MKTFEQLLEANKPAVFPGGHQFILLNCTSPVQVTIFNNKLGGTEVAQDVEAIFKAKYDKPFDRVEVLSTVAQTVKVGITDGEADLATMSGAVDSNAVSGATLESVSDVSVGAATTGLIAAANTDRKELLITNMGASTIRVGDSNAGASRGIPLATGQMLVLTTSAAVYAYNPSGTASIAVVSVKE